MKKLTSQSISMINNVKINISQHLFDKMDKSKHFYDSCLLRIECSAYVYDPLQNNRCI